MSSRQSWLILALVAIILALGRSYLVQNSRLFNRKNKFLVNSRLNIVTEVASAAAFDATIKSAANDKKLVVIDYSTTWCGMVMTILYL